MCYVLESFTEVSQSNIYTAGQAWCADSAAAWIEYGDVATWLTDSNSQYTTVTDLESVFQDCESGLNTDLSDWDTSRVTSMATLFVNCYDYNQDHTGWDTSQVTDMYAMFYGTHAMNGDLSSFDTSKVTDFSTMFVYSGFNQPLDAWDTSSGKDMSFMFSTWSGVYVSLQLSIDNWDVSSVTNFQVLTPNHPSFYHFLTYSQLRKGETERESLLNT